MHEANKLLLLLTCVTVPLVLLSHLIAIWYLGVMQRQRSQISAKVDTKADLFDAI